MDVCADCETSGGLLACTGGCNRSFHAECIGERDAGASDAWRCPECLVSVHRCASCKRYANDADMVVCSQPSCGIRFHDTRECRDGSGVVAGACGRHRCHAPGCAVAADAPQTRCTRCVKAFHAACVPADAHVLSGSAFCCVAHALDGGSAAHGVDAAAAAASGRKRGRAIRDALAPSDSAGAAARAPAAPKGAPSLSAKGIVAVQQRAAAERRRAEAAAEAAETASLVSMARARNASGAGSAAPFSLVAAVSEAVAAASADEGLGSGSWTQVIPGRGRGAELASQRLNQTSAMAWHGPPETQRRQQQPSQTYSAPEHAPERGGASMGSSYGSAGGSTSYAAGLASAPPHAYYDPRQGGHSGEPLWHAPPPQPPALDLQATEGVDSEGRQIFVDAAGSGG